MICAKRINSLPAEVGPIKQPMWAFYSKFYFEMGSHGTKSRKRLLNVCFNEVANAQH